MPKNNRQTVSTALSLGENHIYSGSKSKSTQSPKKHHKQILQSGNEINITQTCTKEPQDPHTSHWDKLPQELRDVIYNFAGVLTRFMCGRIPDAKLTDEINIAIWLDAFDSDWQGDLSLLPNPLEGKYHFMENKHLCRVKSRDMYGRLCQQFMSFTENTVSFGTWDVKINKSARNGGREYLYVDGLPLIRLLHIAMRNVWLDLIQERINKYPYAVANDCIFEGHVDLLRYLIETERVDLERIKYAKKPGEFGEQPMNVAAEFGHLNILVMLHEARNINITERAMKDAAQNGHLNVVRWLHENYNMCSEDVMDRAAEKGHLDIVMWLHEHCQYGCTTWAMDGAAKNGHLHIVKFLHENRSEGCTLMAMNEAAWNGRLEIVQYLHENRSEGCCPKAMNQAAEYGFFDIIKYLDENRTEGCTTDAINEAAKNGHFDIVKYLSEHRTEGCTHKAMDYAARNGHFEIVKYLHQNRSEGCTTTALKWAAWGKYRDIVKFLLENRKEGFTGWAMWHAQSYGDSEMMQMFKAHSHLRRA